MRKRLPPEPGTPQFQTELFKRASALVDPVRVLEAQILIIVLNYVETEDVSVGWLFEKLEDRGVNVSGLRTE